MAQASLGELIQPRTSSGTEAARKDAYASINSKRLDFAIVDKFGLLALAVEYQGSGHYHRKTFIRDAVKRQALRGQAWSWSRSRRSGTLLISLLASRVG